MIVLPIGNEWRFVNSVTLHVDPLLLDSIFSPNELNIRIAPKFSVLLDLVYDRQIDSKLKMYYY